MRNRNRLLSSSCLLGVLLTTACEAPSPPTPAAPPAAPPVAEAPRTDTPATDAPATDTPTTPPTGDVGNTGSALTVSNCRVLTTSRASASGDDGAGSVAANALDDNLSTRWSGPGKGAWLTLDLGSSQSLAGAAIAWHQGDQRQNHFTLSTSEDGTTFSQAYAADSALTTAAQTYRFTGTRKARYLRVTVNGNTVNDWASISEARVCGEDTTTPTPPTTDSGPALPRLPYLQSVGTTSALVAFRTSVSCTPFVRYGEGSDISRTATATAAGWQHAVKLSGLLPGKTYSYVIEACGSVTGVRRFQTATGPETTRVHFTAMGDFGTGGSLQSQVLKLLGQPSRAGEFLLTLGDNAYSSGTDAEFQSNMFKPMAALLREVPLFPSPGNHEYVTNKGQPYLDNFYLPANNPSKSERYYSFDWGPVHFVSLDSNCPFGYTLSDCSLSLEKTWLAQDLAATTRPWKIVFFHHPIWSSGEHGSSTAMRREFAPLFEQYGVDLVLTGHDHNYERSKPMKGDAVAASGTRGIPYLVVGSGGATLRTFPGSQPSWTAYRNNTHVGYLDVAVDGGTLTTKFIDSGGTVRDTLTLTKTVPAAVPQTSNVSALSKDTTPQGPTYDPTRQPAFLGQKPVPPADTAESVADAPEPAHGFAREQQ
ncbi:serine/threonine protein phosphatase [Archangium minus]|uniref:Serine/threonine protein phosphatase n=1 Tax=Archangium minus TaxID=83450 RepID=A0ABY9WLD1_9BACT|nr:serine/threonine protein phosphatase [Archangium minus]